MRYSLQKIAAFDEEITLRNTFLSCDLQCLPPGDPRILCDNIGNLLLANHSLPFIVKLSSYLRTVYFTQRDP